MKPLRITTYGGWEEMEKARAIEASKLTYTERFYILMRLIKITSMIRNAKIIQSPHLPYEK